MHILGMHILNLPQRESFALRANMTRASYSMRRLKASIDEAQNTSASRPPKRQIRLEENGQQPAAIGLIKAFRWRRGSWSMVPFCLVFQCCDQYASVLSNLYLSLRTKRGMVAKIDG